MKIKSWLIVFLGIILMSVSLVFGLSTMAEAGYHNGEVSDIVFGGVSMVVGIFFGGLIAGKGLEQIKPYESYYMKKESHKKITKKGFGRTYGY